MKKAIIASLIILSFLLGVIYLKKQRVKSSLNLTDGITVGTTADFPPFAYRNSSNKIVGFDIDIIKEITKRLDRNLEIRDMAFDSLLPQLKHGSIQVVAAGMSATPERRKNVLFTKPYLTGNPLMVITTADSNIENFESLKNKTIVVNTGYISDIYMSKIPDITLKRVTSIADALLILKNKQADAMVISFQSIKPFLDRVENKEKYKTFAIKETDENISLAVTPVFEKLFKQIQATLEKMESDGAINALKEKWNLV